MFRLRSMAVWAGAILLAAVFVSVGVSKLAGASAMRWVERFEQWGYPANIHYVVGVLEVLGGFGLLIPRLRRAASMTLCAIMAGALGTHLLNGEFPRVIPPLVLGGLVCLLFWAHPRHPKAP